MVPSYEIVRREDGVRIAVPGFEPFAAYDVVLANLVPGLDRREDPSGVEEVLAREALGRVAHERPVGADGYWSLA